MTSSLFELWEHQITQVKLVPSSGGRFEVKLDGELIFSKVALNRHANPGEIEDLIRQQLDKTAAS